MKNHTQKDIWIDRIVALLGITVLLIAFVIVILTLMSEPTYESLLVVGLVMAAGLVRLLFPLSLN